MQIPGSLILQSYPLPLEQQWEKSAPLGLLAPPVTQHGNPPLIQRPVADVKQAEQIYLRHRDPEPSSQPLDDLRARRALDAYDLVQQGQERDYVRSLLGVDEYA